MIPADDRGFTLGDGVFETVLADVGRLVSFEAHVDRMTRSCHALGLTCPDPAELERAAAAALIEAGLLNARAAVRLTWSAGSGGRGLDRPDPQRPRLVVACATAPSPTGPARLKLVSIRRNASSPTSRHKTLAYLDNVLARREARGAGADEAVMLNTSGALACAAAANLFWIKNARLFTPSLDCGVLEGVVRGQTLAIARELGVETAEVIVGPEALGNADAIFITNSLIGVRQAIGATSQEGAALVDALASGVDSLRRSRTSDR